ncbi:unnamed protein product [Dibothriocephalus latus]|uniref:Rgp1 n=1 Tax=Dibothriocephalus latus TaxID=60516 RepID=A0A3P6U2N5_DIBLA|nr:unnamed protein product [Dibothriocephalus latus]
MHRKTLNQRLTVMANSSCVVSLKAILPGKLAPSYRGALLRIAYKAILSWKISYCLGGNSPDQEGCAVASDVRMVHLPFRVLPSFHAYYTPTLSSTSISSFLTSVAVTESDLDSSIQPESTNPFSVFYKMPGTPNSSDGGGGGGSNDNFSLRLNDFLPGVNLHPLVVDCLTDAFKQSLQTSSDSTTPENLPQAQEPVRRSSRKSSPPRSPSTVFAELVSSSSESTFAISAPEGHICRIGLYRTAARLGDCLNGYLDFQNAVVPCLQCTVQLDAYECVDRISEVPVKPNTQTNSSALPLFTVPIQVAFTGDERAPPKLPENARRTSWSEVQLDCANILYLPFSINVPLNAPPEFGLRSNFFKGTFQVRWGLNFQFKTSKTRQRSLSDSSESPGLFDNFIRKHSVRKKNDFTTVVYEVGSVFPWVLPISILPSGPGTFVFPSDSAADFYPALPVCS